MVEKTDYPNPSSAKVSIVMRANRRCDTRAETTLRSALHRSGLRFRKDFPVEALGRHCRPDIVFPLRKVAVFVDGCFWHCCPIHGHVPGGQNSSYWSAKMARNKARDLEDTRVLREVGWTVVRIWEHEPLDVAVKTVLDALNGESI